MSSTSKKLVIFILLLTFIVAGAAIYISIELNKESDVGPTITPAASEEITSAEMANFDDNWDWQAFKSNWDTLTGDDTKDWEDYVEYSLGEGARYKCDEEILTVGKEKLYGCDLNALFVLYDFSKYVEPGSISPQDSKLNAVLDGLITNSALLQEAEKQSLFELDSVFFNSSTKDTMMRFEKVAEARQAFGDLFERTVDFEVISIYFHNEREADVKPIEVAKNIAKKKMDNLYARLESKAITMEQAGQEIMNDKIEGDDTQVSLELLDPLYKENAYMKIEKHKFNAKIFKDSVYDDELRSLGEGQMSTVRVCKDYDFDSLEELIDSNPENVPMVDSCFIIFKVNKINYGLLDNKDEKPQDFEQVLYNNYKQNTENTTGNYFVNLFMSTLKVNAANGLAPHVQHRFKIKLPDGSVHDLMGAKIHQLRKEVATTKEKCKNVYKCDAESTCPEGRDCNCRWEDECSQVPDTYKAVASNYCKYPSAGASLDDIDKTNMANYHCYTFDSCFAHTYMAAYLPISYNSTQAIENDPDASSKKFYNLTFTERFPMLKNLYAESSMRKIPDTRWQATLDYTQGGKVKIVDNHNNDFYSNLPQENGGWGTVNGYAGKQTWYGGEVVLSEAGGNVLHGLITWTLVVSKPPSFPKCVGFNIYDGTNNFPNIIAGSQTTAPTKLLTDTITVRAAASDPDGLRLNMICWTASGLPKTDYYWRKAWTCAAICGPDAASSPEKGVCDDQAAFRGHVTNTIQGFIDKILDATTKQKAKENGLVFVTNIYEVQPGGFCSTNPGYAESGAYFPTGSITTDGQPYANYDTASKCGVAQDNYNCVRRVKIDAAPRCGDDKCDTGEKCDTSKVCDGGTISSGTCRVNCTYCGDGVINGGEECDPKDPVSGPGCDATCKKKVIIQEPKCGDNLCNRPTENCDGTIACKGAGLTASFVCRAPGTVAECTYCGDGVINGGEECDDGNTSNNDGCNTSCLKPNKCDEPCVSSIGCGGGLQCMNGICDGTICEEPPRCGDNKCDVGEACDGNLKCKGNGDMTAGECRVGGANECTYCGDGVVQTTAGEQCDDGNTNNGDSCDNNCRVPAQPRCGDSVVQAGEQCDEGGETANCTASCIRKTIILPTPNITSIVTYTPTPIPSLPKTDLDADEIWIYTMGMGLIGLGLVAYKLNLGYKFAGIVMNNGGLSIILKLKKTRKHMQKKGLIRRSRKDFEKDFDNS